MAAILFRSQKIETIQGSERYHLIPPGVTQGGHLIHNIWWINSHQGISSHDSDTYYPCVYPGSVQ